jgi:hypothetical protein
MDVERILKMATAFSKEAIDPQIIITELSKLINKGDYIYDQFSGNKTIDARWKRALQELIRIKNEKGEDVANFILERLGEGLGIKNEKYNEFMTIWESTEGSVSQRKSASSTDIDYNLLLDDPAPVPMPTSKKKAEPKIESSIELDPDILAILEEPSPPKKEPPQEYSPRGTKLVSPMGTLSEEELDSLSEEPANPSRPAKGLFDSSGKLEVENKQLLSRMLKEISTGNLGKASGLYLKLNENGVDRELLTNLVMGKLSKVNFSEFMKLVSSKNKPSEDEFSLEGLLAANRQNNLLKVAAYLQNRQSSVNCLRHVILLD